MSNADLPDWKNGDCYPSEDASLDQWEFEFLRRGSKGLAGRPHFNIAQGHVEFFVGPAIVQIEEDGSAVVGPDTNRSSATHMLIEFRLDEDIEPQLTKARAWLGANQADRFSLRKRRVRAAKYRTYLRAFDGAAGGASLAEIAAVLYPRRINESPKWAASKQVSKDIASARTLCEEGLRKPLIRK